MTSLKVSRSLIIAGAVMALPVAAIVTNVVSPGTMTGFLDRGLSLVDQAGPWGTALFVGMQIVIAVSGILPAALLGVAAGAAYGVGIGFGLSALGTMLGALIAFQLARSLFRERVERMLASRPRLRGLDARLGRENWRLVCLLRISPVMPFAITSYTLGASSVSASAYMVGSLAALPALFGYVVLGSIAHAGLRAEQAGAGPFRWVVLILGFVATVALTARVGWLVKLALQEETATVTDDPLTAKI